MKFDGDFWKNVLANLLAAVIIFIALKVLKVIR